MNLAQQYLAMEDLVLQILVEIRERILSGRLAGPLKMKSTTSNICFQVLLSEGISGT